MPDFFRFRPDDEYVMQRLTTEERGRVVTWQRQTLDYQFSFHTQHEAGWPVYLSEPNGPGRNLPKINVKVPSPPDRPAFLQGESVRTTANGENFMAVVRGNIPLFQKLAKAYYEPDDVEDVRMPTWVVVFSCKTARQAKPTKVKLPANGQTIGVAYWANFQSFAETPNCPLHRNITCIQSELVAVPATEIAAVKKRFDLNGEIQNEG